MQKGVNWEKLGVYISIIGALYLFWSSQNEIREKISDVRERVKALEVKIERIEERKHGEK